MALSVMGRYKPEQVRWHYEHGLVLQSIYAVGTAVGNNDYRGWVKMMYDTKIMDDGIPTGKPNSILIRLMPEKCFFSCMRIRSRKNTERRLKHCVINCGTTREQRQMGFGTSKSIRGRCGSTGFIWLSLFTPRTPPMLIELEALPTFFSDDARVILKRVE